MTGTTPSSRAWSPRPGCPVPLIAKPNCEGSSKGIRSKCLIEKLEDVGPTVVELAKEYCQGILLEEFIAGEEVTVGVVGNDAPRVLGCLKVVPKKNADRFVYSLEVKREWEEVISYECPAVLPEAVQQAVEAAALAAYDILGIKDYARIDFRIRDGVPYFLEANPLPGINPGWSDLMIIMRAAGMTYEELISGVIRDAMKRYGLASD